MFKKNVIKSINLKCKRFEFCPEFTAKVRKKGYKIYEVPISYNPRSIREGKKIRWKDGFIAIWTLIKYRFID
jgi:dolichol-phosphate mannosyltransferase